MDNKLLEKINYLEKNHEGIIKRFLAIGECANYEKIKKDCGVKISILDKLIELGKHYKDVDRDDIFEDKVNEIINPIDPNHKRDVIAEISVYKENKESENFLHKMLEMYKNYVKKKEWKYVLVSDEFSKKGLLKKVIFEIKGTSIFQHFKYESGFHNAIISSDGKGKNFQKTDVFIKVYPDIKEKEVMVRTEDLKVESFHASTHGGQSVNTSDSAIRITHMPTGISASSQSERSQHMNKENALKIIRARIIANEEERVLKEKSHDRKLIFSEYLNKDRIRKYDFKKNIIMDYRLNRTFHDIKNIMKGNIGEIISELIKYDEIRKINYILDL